MTPEQGLIELVAETWQWSVVEIAMFAHATNPHCRGWTMGTGGKAWCGHCEWEIAARLDDSIGAARFGLVALSLIGVAIRRLLEPAIETIEDARAACDLNDVPFEDPRVELVDGRIDITYTISIKQLEVAWKVDV